MNIGDVLVLTFPIVQLGMLFDRDPSVLSILMVLLSWIMIAVMKFGNHYRRSAKDGKRFRMRSKKKQRRIEYLSEAKSNFQIAGAVLAFVLCATLLFMLVLPGTSYVVSDNRKALKARAHSVLKEIMITGPAYFFGEQGTGGLSQGRLGDVSRVRFDGETDLRIRMAPFTVQRMYLKSFSGRDYEGDRWSDDGRDEFGNAYSEDMVPEYRLDLNQSVMENIYEQLYDELANPENADRMNEEIKEWNNFKVGDVYGHYYEYDYAYADILTNLKSNMLYDENFQLQPYLEGFAPAFLKSLSVLNHEKHLDGSLGLTAGKMCVAQSRDVNGQCIPYYTDSEEVDEMGNPVYIYYNLQTLWDINRDYEGVQKNLQQYYDIIEKERKLPSLSVDEDKTSSVEIGKTYNLTYIKEKSYNEDVYFGNQGEKENLVYFSILLDSLQSAEITRQVRERYLEVPDGNRDAIERFLEDADIHVNDENANVIHKVVEYLDENYTYSLNPGRTPKQSDYINYFLENNKKGFCAHFASAAVLIFRTLGIPARYCEGYAVDYSDVLEGNLVEDEDVKEWISGTSTIGQSAVVDVEISDENAHAWCEIYLDSFGWVVVDPTPASDEEEDDDFLSSLSNMGDVTGNMTNALGNMTLFTGNLPINYIVLILLMGVLLFVAGRKIYLRRKRIKSYQTEDSRQNILAYYQYLKNVLAVTGCEAGPGITYSEYGDEIAKAGYLSKEEAALLMEEIQEKAYGEQAVQAGEAASLLELMQRAVDTVYQSVSPWRRFLLHIFYCC